MRRTYRSKKDTANVVERRDLFQNLDGKSTAYDAFSIQNIKQTKRELSCVGSSNPLGVASSRVRKKKYVKRIVKEVELPCRESMSNSAYLTPDKSIRVNKALDPFDLLLISSPANSVKSGVNNVESVSSKMDLFDQIRPMKEGRTYTKRKPKEIKKLNYSSTESSDSDKENSDSRTQNTSDIKSHKLLVEREIIATPNKVDKSINNIVKNLSLLNKLKHKYNTDDSINKSLRLNRHRLTKNIHSPILQKSPLCSTPFKVKYRGESIYKFSPITAINTSPKYITINEDSNDCNHSLILQGKKSTEKRSNKSIKLAPVDKIGCGNKACTKNDADTVTTEKAESNDANAISSIEISSLQTTESEPFLGFSHKTIDEVIAQNEDKYERSLLSYDVIHKKCITKNEATKRHTNLNQNNTDSDNDITKLEVRNDQYVEDDQSQDVCEYNAYEKKSNVVNTSALGDDNNSNITAACERNDVENLSDVIDASGENIIDNNNHSNVKSHILEGSEDSNVGNASDVSVDASGRGNDNHSNIEASKENIVDKPSDFSSNENETGNDNHSHISERSEESDVENPTDVSFDATEDRGNDNYSNCTEASEENIVDNPSDFSSNENEIGNDNHSHISETSEESNVENPRDVSVDASEDRGNDNYSNCIEASEENVTDNDNYNNITEASQENIAHNDTKVSSDSNKENDDVDLSECSSSDDTNSFYDTCTSEQSSIQEIEDKEPVVLLQKMNDSSFFRYYGKLSLKEDKNNITESTDTEEGSIHSEFASIRDNDTQQSSGSELESDLENNSDGDDKSEEIECNNDEQNSSSDEKCVSFVTTRRRNEVTNDSMISMFNDSYCSTSTDCDKTVLSNNVQKTEAIDNNDTLILDTDAENNEMTDNVPNLNKDTERTNGDDLNKHPECLDDTTTANESRISFVTDRKSSIRPRNSSIKSINLSRESFRQNLENSRMSCSETKPCIVLRPGKKWERSLSIYRRMTMMTDHFDHSMLDVTDTATKGRKYRQSIISTMEMQDFNSSLHNESINSRRSTFVSKPSRSTIVIVKDPNRSSFSCNTTVFDDLTGFLNEECDDTIIELSKLSIADQTHEVTVLDNFHDPPNRIATARDYVLRRCNQADAILFDECYPDTVLKNCHKIGEGVYGEVFLWRDRDGRARVLKIVPVAGNLKVNGESQKDFHEIISEIVIAMELSALRAPIAEIERHFDEGKDVEALDLHAIENASDIFNEVLAVKCVYGSYPSRLLDLWDLYDECKGSENDNPAILPVDQQFIVLELANAGQDLESYQFNNAEQAHALFLQVAYGLAVAEEAFQFEHRDLHWGNVLIAPTEKKYATFVIRGRLYRVARCGVLATVIDYSLSRVSVRLAGECAALYNDLAADETLFDAVGDYQFQVYRLMRDKLRNDWKNFEPYTNILWLHYTVDKMITALRYKRTNTKIHKHYIDKLKGIKSRILDYGSAAQFVLTDNEI